MNPAPARRGFTLVELIVASAIMVILVLVVVKVANDTLSAYDRVVADLSAQTEARAVLDNLERDLNAAVIRPDGRCWMEIIAPGANASGALPTGIPPTANFARVPNVPADLQPVILLFSSPTDRPRFRPGMPTRDINGNRINEIRGDVCAVAYRMGLRSPFDSPGDLIQQVYCVQRTIIDGENTFKEALSGANAISAANPPSAYWVGSRTIANFSVSPAATQAKVLFDGTLQGGWTMNEDNFCAQNVVAMSVVLWCASTENKVTDLANALARPAFSGGLPPEVLRPVFMHAGGTGSNPAPHINELSYRTPTSAANFGPMSAFGGFLNSPNSGTSWSVAPRSDRYGSRARIYSDRIFLDARPAAVPYVLRQVEVSVTVLTPAGARELRALQRITNSATFAESTTSNFRRIVYQHGRPYSRRIQILGNGG